MEAEGFLEILPRKGALVRPVSDRDIEAVMEARSLVEDWCIRRVAATQPGLAQRLEQLLVEQRELLDEPTAFIECDRRFHRTIVRAAGNQVLADFYELLRDRQMRMGLIAIAAAEDRQRLVLDEHAAITAGIGHASSKEAAAAIAEHLANTLAALRLPRPLSWEDEDSYRGARGHLK
jgi:DNA-binding GntR family transcriptional regulator